MTTRPYIEATIAISTTTSGRLDLKGFQAGAIIFPAAFTGATISFEIPDGEGGWAALNGISLTPVVSEGVALTEAQAFALGDDFRIVSASSEAAARTLFVVRR